MSSKHKKQDAFQSELTEALRKRREMEGLNPQLREESETEDDEESEDDDDYYDDDDFEDDELVIPTSSKKSPKYTTKSKGGDDWDLPSFLKDDDDFLSGGSSSYLKGKQQKTFTKQTFDPLGMGKMAQTTKVSAAVESNSDTNEDEEDDPILALLRGDKTKSTKQSIPTPSKRTAKNDTENRVKSPVQTSKSPRQPERAKSPIAGITSPKGRKSPGISHKSPSHSPNRSLEMKGTAAKPRALERQQHVINEGRPRTPGSGKESPELKGILDTMRSATSEDAYSAQLHNRKTKKEADKSQEYINFILNDDQPKPVPRKKGSKSPSVDSDHHRTPTRSLSPTLSKSVEKTDHYTTQRTRSGDVENNRESTLRRSLSPSTEKPSLFSLPPPPLQSTKTSLTSTSIGFTGSDQRASIDTRQQEKSDKAKTNAEADDLLALFNQATTGVGIDFQAHKEQKHEERKRLEKKTPAEDVVQRTSNQRAKGEVHQRVSQQILNNAIDVVAEHNTFEDVSSTTSKPEPGTKKSPRAKSGKKSYRTPPANYQGLGSLTMLKELKKSGKDEENEKGNVSTEDIRKRVYLEWLAKREEETKKKRKEEALKKKEQEEKERKEREEKEHENLLVRRKWDEVKAEELKEKEKEKRRKQKKEKEEQEAKEKQKLKSQKDADRKRQTMQDAAQHEHEAEMRKKREEERKKKREEDKQKKENEKAMDKWMSDRSAKWVEDRKKEQREKRLQERKVKQEKEEAAKEAEEKYNTWREHKDNQLKTTMREQKLMQRRRRLNIEDEENYQPPWSPASKVIPRKR